MEGDDEVWVDAKISVKDVSVEGGDTSMEEYKDFGE